MRRGDEELKELARSEKHGSDFGKKPQPKEDPPVQDAHSVLSMYDGKNRGARSSAVRAADS